MFARHSKLSRALLLKCRTALVRMQASESSSRSAFGHLAQDGQERLLDLTAVFLQGQVEVAQQP